MTTNARYTVGADALADWRDSLFNGSGPKLYAVGTGGLQSIELGPGRVVLFGGLPGGGKTALTMQFVIDALRAEPELRAVICNVEMTTAVLMDRQLARLSGVPLDAIRLRQLDATHAERIDAGLATLDAIADRLAFLQPPYDLGNVAATADDFGGELLVLDYLQRIKPPGAYGDRRGSVDALMDHLRQFADAGCAVLAISAMARSKDNRGRSSYSGDSLSLASFRESSELEYGADAAYVLVPEADPADVVTLRCLKHRHGEPSDVGLQFERRYQRFAPLEPEPAGRGKVSVAQLAALWGRTAAADDDGGGDA